MEQSKHWTRTMQCYGSPELEVENTVLIIVLLSSCKGLSRAWCPPTPPGTEPCPLGWFCVPGPGISRHKWAGLQRQSSWWWRTSGERGTSRPHWGSRRCGCRWHPVVRPQVDLQGSAHFPAPPSYWLAHCNWMRATFSSDCLHSSCTQGRSMDQRCYKFIQDPYHMCTLYCGILFALGSIRLIPSTCVSMTIN